MSKPTASLVLASPGGYYPRSYIEAGHRLMVLLGRGDLWLAPARPRR